MANDRPAGEGPADPKTPKQRQGIRRTVLALLLVVAAVVGLQVYKFSAEPTLDRAALREEGVLVFDQPRQITDFELKDHKGQPFSSADLEGQWTLIFFGFTQCPDICPLAMADLSRLMDELPPELEANTQVLMVTLDPARDTPEVLADYVPYFHKDFVGVTGEFLTIRRFANELNVAFSKVTQGEDNYTIDHSGHISLINPRGDYHALFKPPFNADKMARHYAALVEAAPL